MPDEWKPPRRNGHYLRIGRQTHSLQEWSRRCGISHNNLCNERRRNGHAAMIQRIKLGLQQRYTPTTGGAFHKSNTRSTVRASAN
jgi:hypothetical protein